MRSRFRTHLRACSATLLLAAAVVACGGDDAGGDGDVLEGTAPDRVLAGPQGTVGQFVVECRFDRYAPDDPIVHPGHPGASHLHQFFGAVAVTAESRYDELVAGDTTCDQHADTAGYWSPALVGDDGEPIEPIRAVAYYRAGPSVDPSAVVAYPPGLMLVAGDATSIDPQPVSLVAWTCGSGSVRASEPPDCSGGPSLRMLVTYPDCWNGRDLAAGDWAEPQQRHAAYSADGECPDGFEVHIPQLQLAIDYPPVAADELDGLVLSSGHIHTGHADFWNTWDQTKLENEVRRCINADLVCNVSD